MENSGLKKENKREMVTSNIMKTILCVADIYIYDIINRWYGVCWT